MSHPAAGALNQIVIALQRRERRMVRAPEALAIVIVIVGYVFYASAGTFHFSLEGWESTQYGKLAEGFRWGQLSTAEKVDPRLIALSDPYRVEHRQGIFYPWDLSLYKGKYYLYFTPLPALLVYLPVRLIWKAYPSDAIAGVVLTSAAFLIMVAALARALRSSAPKRVLPLPAWILVLGLGTVMPYVATDFRTYEIAIVTGMMFSAAWAWAVVRFMATPSARAAALTGLLAALALNARPNLGVILLVTAAAVLTTDRRIIVRCAVAAAIPVALVLLSMAAYNYARFESPFELGVTYQLTSVPMRNHAVCSICRPSEVARFLNSVTHYLFWAPAISSRFPFVRFRTALLDRTVSYPGEPEAAAGIACITPLAMIGSLCAGLLALRWRENDAQTRAGVVICAAGWLVMLGLATCWWVVARYALDFYALMLIGAIVSIERCAAMMLRMGFSTAPLRALCWILACYSLVLALLVGLAGPSDAFRLTNPTLYKTIETRLTRLSVL